MLLAVATALCFCSCSVRPPEPLRIGINIWPGYEFLYLAKELEFYAQEGVTVQLVEFNSLSDARRSFERGQIDGFATTCVEVMQARDNSNRSPQIVQVVDYSDGGDVIVARSPIESVSDLKGKKVGVELASLGIYIIAVAMERSDIEIEDIFMVPSDQLSMASEFAKGSIDAVVTYPPVSLSVLHEPGAKVVFSTSEVPGEVIDVIAIDAPVIKQRPQDVRNFLRAFNRAQKYAELFSGEAFAIMAEREKISPEEFGRLLDEELHIIPEEDQKLYLEPGGLLEEVIKKTDKVLRQTGQIVGPDRRRGAYTDEMIK